MNQDEINTIDLSSLEPIELTYEYISTGIIAEETGPAYTTMQTSPNTVTLSSGISITATGIAAGSSYTISTPYDDIVDRLSRLEQIIAEEEEVRKNHPAVQMAYDEYRLLYILAKKNPGDHLTDE